MTAGPERAGFSEAAGRTITRIYADATAEVLEQVARRLARGITRPGWAEEKLHQLLDLQHDVSGVIAKLDKASQARAGKLIAEAYALGRSPGIVLTNVRAVEALAHDIAGLADDVMFRLSGTHPRILRWADDVYRDVISDAVKQTAAGTLSTRAAAQRALDRFTARGVTGFIDRTGQSWSLTSYAEMAVRTGTMRAHLAGTTARLQENGFDLVEVQGLTESCPVCLPWQGAILSLSGTSPQYPALSLAIDAGLFHPNCRHDIDAFTPGFTKPPDLAPDGTVRQNYEDRMRQRALERRVRGWKYRTAAADPFGDTTETLRDRAGLRSAQADLRAFLEATGRKRLPYRESI